MRFDNKQFEAGVQTSLSTLDKLKQSLNFTGAVKGLTHIGDTVKNTGMNVLGSAVDGVRARFSSLDIIAMTTLSRITNAAISTGKQMLQSLTIAPIKQGFQEYELKMGSVQTIMASTGETIDVVNGYLEELNTYSDKTIYSFADMTQNIGKFTNAGVSLDDAVNAIKGISNEAALSGANANEASRAMYNFAQALSAGSIRLIDWKSIENANMATKGFKEELLKTAEALGTVKKEGDSYVSTTTDMQGKTSDAFTSTTRFNESLSSQWMTTDVLIETLKKYADETTEIGKKAFSAAQDVKTFSQLMDTLREAVGSGWAQTYEILFGNLEEAKALWTSVSNVVGGAISESAKARNDLLKGWKEAGGRTTFIDGLTKSFEAFQSVLHPIKDAFRDIFPKVTVDQLVSITNSFKEFASNLTLSDQASTNLRSSFKGLFSIFDIVGQAISAVANALKPLFGSMTELGGSVLAQTASWGEWLTNLSNAIRENDTFTKAINKTVDAVRTMISKVKEFGSSVSEFANKHLGFVFTIGNKIKEVFQGVKGSLSDIGKGIADRILARFEQLKNVAISVKDGLVSVINSIKESISTIDFFSPFKGLFNGITEFAGRAVERISGALSKIGEAFRNVNFSNVLDVVNTATLGGIGIAISQFLTTLTAAKDVVTSPFKSLNKALNTIADCLTGVKDVLAAYQEQLKAETLMKIAKAIALLAGSIFVISLVDSERLNASLGAITVLFGDLVGSMALFSKIPSGAKGIAKTCSIMISLAASVAILSLALAKVASIDSDKLAQSVVAIMALTGDMIIASKLMSTGSKTMLKGAKNLILLAVAVKILASTCEDLSSLKWEELGKGLAGVGGLLLELSLFTYFTKGSKDFIKSAIGTIAIAAAIKILASACSDFSTFNWDEIEKALGTIGTLLTELSLFTNFAGNANHIMSTGMAVMLISASLKILASVMSDFAAMNLEQIKNGLIAMGGALAEISIALNLIPTNAISKSAGVAVMAGSLLLIFSVMEKLGGLSAESITKSLIAMGGALTEFAIALHFMEGTIDASASLVVAALGIKMLMNPILEFSKMSWGEIAKGLIVLASSIAVLGIAGAALTPVIPAMIGLGAALGLLGIGMAGIGVGIAAVSAGMIALATAGTAGATAFVASLSIILTGIAKIIIDSEQLIGELITTVFNAIKSSATTIASAVKEVLLAILDMLKSVVPELVDTLLYVVSEILDSLATHIPNIVSSVFEFLVAILDGVAAELPSLIESVVNVFMAFFEGAISALEGIDLETLLEGLKSVGIISGMMLALTAVAALTPGAMLGVLGIGAVVGELGLVIAAIGALAQIPGLDWFIGEGGNLLQTIGTAIGQFVGGIVGGIAEGVTSQLVDIANDLSGFMVGITPFIMGAKMINSGVMDGVKSLAGVILSLTAADILNGVTSWLTGGSSLTDFGKQLAEFGPYFKQYYDSVDGIDPAVVQASATAASALATLADELPDADSPSLKSWIFGKKISLDEFGNQLKSFGEAIAGYSAFVDGKINEEAVTASVNAAKVLTALADELPESESPSLKTWIFGGTTSLGSFSEQLKSFGQAMADFSGIVDGSINTESVSKTAELGQAFSDLANTLPKYTLFKDDTTLSEFGEYLVDFGKAMSKFSKYSEDVDADAISSIATSLEGLCDIDPSNLTELSDSLSNLGKDAISDFVGTISDSESIIENASKSIIEYSVAGINNKKSEFIDALTGLVDSALSDIRHKYSEFKTAGKTLVSYLASGIRGDDKADNESGSTLAVTAFSDIVDNVLGKLKDKSSNFYSCGYYLAQGFANGITAGQVPVIYAATKLGEGASEALAEATEVASPSKVAYRIGNFFVKGFTNAIHDSANSAYKESLNLGSMANDALASVAAIINQTLQNGVEFAPTIRPVLDTSQLTNGVGYVNAMFNKRQAMQVVSSGVTPYGSRSSASRTPNFNLDVQGIRSDLNNIKNIIGNLKIVMDTGTLVGAIASPMDKALGTKAMYNRRGV